MAYSYRPEKRRERPITGYVLPAAGERRRRRIPHRRPILFAVLVGLLMIAAGSLYMSPIFRVQEIQVIGTAGVDSELVRELAKLDGKSMFHLPLDKIERRIASGLPLVKAAEAERNWPQSVQITLLERTTWGYWASGNITYAIDQEGVVLEESVSPIIGMPLIRDLDASHMLVGDRVDTDSIMLAIRLAEEVPQLIGLEISSLEHREATGLTAVTSGDYRVVLGDLEDYEYKLAVWKAMESTLGREVMSGHILDLRYGDRPSFR